MDKRKFFFISLLLCFVFFLYLLISSLLFAPKAGTAVYARKVDPALLMTGRDDPDTVTVTREFLPSERIDLNTATAEELQRLDGIGPVLAEAIVKDREQNGPFQSVEELTRVPGIGEKRLEAVRDYVEIGG